jgi:anti-sigma regulatory factor (Ser/Thr protein kinase)
MTLVNSVRDTSEVGEARRAAVGLAHRKGLSKDIEARIAIVATELATNLLKHAGEGLVAINEFVDANGAGIELIALDKGPGIADIARCLVDGFSTAGSPGTGLGAITRVSDSYAIYSRPGIGTTVMARFLATSTVPCGAVPRGAVEIGVVMDTYPGESVCGDGWATANGRMGVSLLLVDGSGHGPLAAHAAEIAARAFADNIDKECVPLVEAIHRALAPTRGAALAVARIDRDARMVRFVGVGNISAVMANGGESRRMVSYNGTAGHVAPRIREFTYPFTGKPLVILHSDGLSARWEIATYPGLAAGHPSLVAGLLFRHHRRGRDDATVVAMRAVT